MLRIATLLAIRPAGLRATEHSGKAATVVTGLSQVLSRRRGGDEAPIDMTQVHPLAV
jgi:hypothetical protein